MGGRLAGAGLSDAELLGVVGGAGPGSAGLTTSSAGTGPRFLGADLDRPGLDVERRGLAALGGDAVVGRR